MSLLKGIRGDDVEGWSRRGEAAALLPELVRRLLLATVVLRAIDIRADGGTRLGGWDGLVDAVGVHPYCPQGVSAWEFSVEGKRTKFDGDFSKRSNEPGPVAPSRTTYVAVTARRFKDKQAWLRACNKIK